MALAALLVLLSFAAVASASTAQVSEFPLGPQNFSVGAITAGPDGNMWFKTRNGLGESSVDEIGRITPAGEIAKFPLPGPGGRAVRSIVSGPDGNLWFTAGFRDIGRITPSGEISEFQIPGSSYGITSGLDGNLWFTETASVAEDWEKIVRMTTSGQMTRFPLPPGGIGHEEITTGPDGNLWFPHGNKIGRMTPTGQLTEFLLPPAETRAAGITVGPEGNLWFMRGSKNHRAIGRITTDGQVTEFPYPKPTQGGNYGRIVTGADGRLWFVDGPGLIGRMSPTGRYSQVSIPWGAPVDVTSGPDGTVWYVADSGSCLGGGLSCQTQIPSHSALVGRITPGPLAVGIASHRKVAASPRWAQIKLICEDGNADSVCRGALRLKTRLKDSGRWFPGLPRKTATLAHRHYRLPVDSNRTIALRLTPKAISLLKDRHRLWVRATATAEGGEGTGRAMLLQSRLKHKHNQ